MTAAIIALAIIKTSLWLIPAIAAACWVAYMLDPDARFDRHCDDALQLTKRPSVGDEAEAYLRGRFK